MFSLAPKTVIKYVLFSQGSKRKVTSAIQCVKTTVKCNIVGKGCPKEASGGSQSFPKPKTVVKYMLFC